MSSVDPVDLLGSFAPPAGWNERTDLSTDQRAASILDRVLNGTVVPFRSRRRRLGVATGIVVTIAVGGAAVAALWERSVDESRVVGCWSEAAIPPEAQVALAWDGENDPIGACTGVWTRGELGTTTPPAPLHACVYGSGSLVVVPGADGVCGSIGLADAVLTADPADGGDDEPMDATELERILGVEINSKGCMAVQEAESRIREIRERLQIQGWDTRTLSADGVEEQCATAVVNRELGTIDIVQVPGPD